MRNMLGAGFIACLIALAATGGLAATLSVPTGYATIAAAIAAASDGDTIEIAAGTYYEDNFDVTKSLTIRGADTSGAGGAYQSKTIVRVATTGSTIAYVHECDGATIEHITFDRNGTAGIAVLATGWEVDGNVVPLNCTVRDCRVIGTPGAFGSNQWCAMEALNAAYKVTFERNLIEGTGTGDGIGIVFAYDVTIKDNIVDGQGSASAYGISGLIYGPVTVTGNVVTGCQYGIYHNQADFTITDNIVFGNQIGVVCARGSWDAVVNNNAIYDNGTGMDCDSGKVLDAENNWWGSENGPADTDGTNEMPDNPTSAVADMLNVSPAGQLGNSVVMSEIDYYPWLNMAPAGLPTGPNLVASDIAGAIGETVQLEAQLTDGTDPLPGQSVSFFVDGTGVGSGTTDAAGVAYVSYTIAAAGNKTIAARFAGALGHYLPASDTATLTVGAAPVTAITLTVTPGSVASGQGATCTVLGNNGVNYTSACRYYAQYGAGGSWASNVYTAGKTGTWTLTAVYNTLTDSKPLTVTHGTATGVTLTPATATINSDGSQAYVVTGTDAAGNTWTPAASCLSENGAGSFTDYTYNAAAGDAGNAVTVTATVDGQVGNATLNVNAAAGPGTILAWDKDTYKFYLCSNPTDPQSGTEITGTGTFNGVACTVTAAGSTNVTVTAGGASLRVAWYLRSGALYRVCEYSEGTASGSQTATYYSGRTLIGGMWQTGFYGLTHTITGGVATLGSAQQ